MRRSPSRRTRTALAVIGLAFGASTASAQDPPVICPAPGQGYEIAGCFVDAGGDEYPAGGTVAVHDLAFDQALTEVFAAGTFVADAFLVEPPSSPPASCGSCGPVDFCVVVDFNPSAVGTPLARTFCAPGDPTVNDGGFDLRSLNGGQPLVAVIPDFTVGGSVSGLAGSGLVLRNNGGDDLPIGSNGAFTFATPIANGLEYEVTVAAQPTGPSQDCTVAGGSGTLDGGDVTNVTVTCVTRTADLSIGKSDGLDSSPAGAPLTYVIQVGNAGPEDAFGARVVDVLPVELSNAAWDCMPEPGASCPASGSGDIDTLVDLAAGSGLVFTLTAIASNDLDATVINQAEVIAPDDLVDPNPGNNTASDTTSLNGVFQDGFEAPDFQLMELLEPPDS